jgi:hypothetical protein
LHVGTLPKSLMRLFELAKKLYLVAIKVERYEQGSESGEDSDGDEEHRGDDDKGNFDDCDDLDDEPENMETDKQHDKKSEFKTHGIK